LEREREVYLIESSVDLLCRAAAWMLHDQKAPDLKLLKQNAVSGWTSKVELPATLFSLVKEYPHREKMHHVCYRLLYIMCHVDFECFVTCIMHVHNSLSELLAAATTKPAQEGNNNAVQPKKEMFLLDFVTKLVDLAYNSYSAEEMQLSQFIGEAIDLNLFVFLETSGKYSPLENQAVFLLGKLFDNVTLQQLFFSARDLEAFLKKFFASQWHVLLAQPQLHLETFAVSLAQVGHPLIAPELVESLVGLVMDRLAVFANNVLQDIKVDENLLALVQGLKIFFAFSASEEQTTSWVKNKEKEATLVRSITQVSSKDAVKGFARLEELLQLIAQLK